MLQAELQRVHARPVRQSVDVRFARERVRIHRRRAPRSYAERLHARGIAAHPAPGRCCPVVRNVVEVIGLAIATTHRLEIPECDPICTGEPGSNLHNGGWTERIVEELLSAVPHHLHRPSRGFRQTRRFHCLRPIGFSAKAAAYIGRDDAHVLLGHVQRLRHLPLHLKRRLRAGPHCDTVPVHSGQRRVRFRGGVRNVTVPVDFLDDNWRTASHPRSDGLPRRPPAAVGAVFSR